MTKLGFKCRFFDIIELLATKEQYKKLSHTKIFRDTAKALGTNLSPKGSSENTRVECVAYLHALSIILMLSGGRYRPRRPSFRFTRLPPECVREDSYGTTCSPHIFNLATRNPIVDCSTTDTHLFACLHDRKRFPVNNHHNFSSLNSRTDLITDRLRIAKFTRLLIPSRVCP